MTSGKEIKITTVDDNASIKLKTQLNISKTIEILKLCINQLQELEEKKG